MNEEFIKDLDVETKRNCKIVLDFLANAPVKVLNFRIEIEPDEDFQKKHGLNKDIRCVADVNPGGGEMEYYYKDVRVEPDGYYIRPEKYHEVSTVRMLQECIKQDTARPDIKYLEDGKKKPEKKKNEKK